jgi:hypothetical protein
VLRDGRAVPDAPAALVLVMDDLSTLGASAVLLEVRAVAMPCTLRCCCSRGQTLHSYANSTLPKLDVDAPWPPQSSRMLAAAISEGRGQGRALHGVAADRPPAELAAAGAAAVIDLFSDPCGWLSGPEECGDVSEDRGEPGTSTSSDSLHRADGQRGPWQSSGLRQLAELAGRQAPEPLCLVIDSLSALLLRHPAAQVRPFAPCANGASAPAWLVGPCRLFVQRGLHAALEAI